MARVTGVGGVFLRSADPARLAGWYAEHLRMAVGPEHAAILSWSEGSAAGTGMTVWSAFPQDTVYFGAGGQAAMINYRVDDLEALLEHLRAAEVWIDPHREDLPYGQFAWIKDCDGNRLELWQPIERESIGPEPNERESSE